VGDGSACRISFADMCGAGVRGLLVYCPDYRGSHTLFYIEWEFRANFAV
jgi:hypothetical protein